RDMKETEKNRVLLELLPTRNFAWHKHPQSDADGDGVRFLTSELSWAFGKCFRVVRDHVSWETKRKVIEQYVSILKEQAADYRKCYEETFFKFADLAGVADEQATALIKSHVLSRLQEAYDPAVLAMAEGIGSAITAWDVKHGEAAGVLVDLMLWSPPGNVNDVA